MKMFWIVKYNKLYTTNVEITKVIGENILAPVSTEH